MGGAVPSSHAATVPCVRLSQNIDRPPSEYLKQFYYDTVNFNPSNVRLALDFAGPDRILAGSDYPHQIGSIPLMVETIGKLDVSEEVKTKIYGANADALLGLGPLSPG